MADTPPPITPPSTITRCSPAILNATACYSCGAAAVHAMGIPGLRASEAWIASHAVICPATESES